MKIIKIIAPAAAGLALVTSLSMAHAQPFHDRRHGPPGWSSAPHRVMPPAPRYRGQMPPPHRVVPPRGHLRGHAPAPHYHNRQHFRPTVGEYLPRDVRIVPLHDYWRFGVPRAAYGTRWGRVGDHLILVSDRDRRILRVVRIVG